MKVSEAEAVLRVLNEVNALDDVQAIVDRVCECAVEISSFRVALLSLYFGDDVYIGLEGGDEAMRRSFLDNARAATDEQRENKRRLIWTNHRIGETSICFIPAGSDVPFGASFRPSPGDAAGGWQAADRLMVFVRGADGEVRGVLSLDEPSDGRRPDPADLGSLAAVDRLIDLIGVVIHNKHLAAKLRESEERYAAVVEQGHDGILIEREGSILFANRRLGKMLGTAPSLLVGRAVDSVVRVLQQVSMPGEQEGHLLRGDRPPLDIAIRRSQIGFGGGTATLVAVADITERKRVFSRLMRAMKMDSVGTLASGIAHDFNNLLGGILGYASLLRMRIDGEEETIHRYVDAIERAADRAAGVTRQLLGIVRDEQVHVAPFDVRRILEDIGRLFQETLDPSIVVEVAADDNLPRILGDETQIHQVILNMCLNARDAMPNGGSLGLRAERAPGKGGVPWVRVTVRDTGTGMDAETLAKIFDPFFTTKKSGHGTGLGLYMAYRVIERHGGQVDVTSKPGLGTSVVILLPASGVDWEAVKEEGTDAGASGGGTVLLVDDEELMRDVAAEMLERLHYTVLTAADGHEAVEVVERLGDRIRVVVLDIAMPLMNGWEAAAHIRRLRPEIPIVISSGHDVSAAMGDTNGIDDAVYLKKPYRLENLDAVLKEALRAASRPALSREP